MYEKRNMIKIPGAYADHPVKTSIIRWLRQERKARSTARKIISNIFAICIESVFDFFRRHHANRG